MPADVRATVIANTPLSADYNVVALAAPGQFVMIRTATGHDPLLRRPFSVFEVLSDRSGAASGISLLNKRIGPSTTLLYEARPGQQIACLGPLGRPFRVIDPPCEAWMIAGGVGLAPFAALAVALRARGVRMSLFYGARRSSELFYLDWFRDHGVTLMLTTEDGSAGEAGRVTDPLERHLLARPAESPLMMFACGPEGMLAAVARSAARHRRPCQVSVERIMGCGLGGCYSCVVPMRAVDGKVHHVRSCLAGPVLAADEIVWESDRQGAA